MHKLLIAFILLPLVVLQAHAGENGTVGTEIKVTGMEFIAIPAGCFQMGNVFEDPYFTEMPVHEVCVNDFNLGKYDVTRGEFRKFVAETSYRTEAEKGDGCYIHSGKNWRKEPAANWRSPGFPQDDNHPVVCVSWHDATAFALWFSGGNAGKFRLPSEAEWEYAARSGGKRERYAGGDDIEAVAWFSENSAHKTHPVGQKRANGLGLYDMSGNVWQWTADWYDVNYYRKSPSNNPIGPPSGSKRVFRGGSWFYDARGIRTSFRDFFAPDFRSSYLGFRLATSPL